MSELVGSGATRDFVSSVERLPGGAIRALGADGNPIGRTTLTLPVNDEFRQMLPLGAPVSEGDSSLGHWISSGIDPRVASAMKNVNGYQVEAYGEGDPRTPYLGSMNYWMFDTVRAIGFGEWMMFSEVDPQEAITLLAVSALAHGVKEGALMDILMHEMHSSPRRPNNEIRVARGLLHAAFVGLNAKDKT